MARPYRTFSNKKPRQTSERQLKLDLEYLVSQITRRRTAYCVLCGESNWNRLEAGHFWHRAMPPTEFDLDNLRTLCRSCNQRHEHDPQPYRDYMLLTLGERGFDDLACKAHGNQKVGYCELFNLRNEMQSLFDELKAA